jgi:hypothetical protein
MFSAQFFFYLFFIFIFKKKKKKESTYFSDFSLNSSFFAGSQLVADISVSTIHNI